MILRPFTKQDAENLFGPSDNEFSDSFAEVKRGKAVSFVEDETSGSSSGSEGERSVGNEDENEKEEREEVSATLLDCE